MLSLRDMGTDKSGMIPALLRQLSQSQTFFHWLLDDLLPLGLFSSVHTLPLARTACVQCDLDTVYSLFSTE